MLAVGRELGGVLRQTPPVVKNRDVEASRTSGLKFGCFSELRRAKSSMSAASEIVQLPRSSEVAHSWIPYPREQKSNSGKPVPLERLSLCKVGWHRRREIIKRCSTVSRGEEVQPFFPVRCPQSPPKQRSCCPWLVFAKNQSAPS